MDDILAVLLNDSYARIMPPKESDSESVQALKLFMLACLTRRNMDPGFNQDMAEWFSTITEEEFRASHSGKKMTKQ